MRKHQRLQLSRGGDKWEGDQNLYFQNQPRKQHIVPVDYLEHFESGEGILWAYAKGFPARPSIAKNEAAQRDYFEVTVPGYETRFLFEKQLQRLEDSAKPGLDRLRRSERLNADDCVWASHYIVNLFLRSRHVRERLTNQVSQRELLTDESLREEQLRYCRATGNIAPFEELRSAMERAVAIYGDTALLHVDVLRRNSPPLVALLQQRSWQIVEPDDSSVFVTSDAPVVSFQSRDYQIFAGYGWGRENAHVALPLTPKRLLLISPHGWNWDRKLDATSTETMNKLIASFAYRHVFSSRNSEAIQLIMNNVSSTQFGINAYLFPNVSSKVEDSTIQSVASLHS